MNQEFPQLTRPELVIGIAGPIGIDIDEINRSIEEALKRVGYRTVGIRITEEIKAETSDVPLPEANDFGSQISYKMSHASAICRAYGEPDTLMRFAIKAIQKYRKRDFLRSGKALHERERAEERVVPSTAYVIRQLKRPEEVHLLRKVYGKQFILISAYGGQPERKRSIEKALKRDLPVDIEQH